MSGNPPPLVRLKYEVFGKVQGKFFRKHTLRMAERLGVGGWVRNTSRGTVLGEVEGPRPVVEEFKAWVADEGSPKSSINRCVFSEEYEVDSRTYDEFKIIRKR
jgi:acylphosphatase